MKEIIEALETYNKTREVIATVEADLSRLKSIRDATSRKICDLFRDNMVDQITLEGHTIKARIEPQYSIKGGAKSTPERTEVIGLLEELGYGDGIKTYKEMHEKTFQKVMRNLPFETRAKLIEDKKITVFERPVIKVTKQK